MDDLGSSVFWRLSIDQNFATHKHAKGVLIATAHERLKMMHKNYRCELKKLEKHAINPESHEQEMVDKRRRERRRKVRLSLLLGRIEH